MSKKLCAIAMALMLMFLLAGCGGDSADTATDEAKSEASAEHPTGDAKKAEHPTGEHPTADADTAKADHPK